MALGISPESLALRSARHPLTTIALWVLTFVVAVALYLSLFGDAITTQFIFTNTPESQRGVDLMEELRGAPISTNEVLIVQSDTLTVDSPAYKDFVEDLYGKVAALRTVSDTNIVMEGTFINYFQTGAPFLVSEDRQTTITPFIMAGNFDAATDNIDSLVKTRFEEVLAI